MNKTYRVGVEGSLFDVTVETAEENPVPPAPRHQAAASSVEHVPTGPLAVSGPREVKSPLAGLVTKVLVIPGQAVKEGDHVLTLEAMKVYNYVFAPANGRVRDIAAEAGRSVKEGQTLLVIE